MNMTAPNAGPIKKTYSSGVLSETRHFFYTEPPWQVVEERVDSSSNPNRHFVWGLRYVDDIILRDRDTDGNGTLDERLYGMQDANWNVTGIVNVSGTVLERYSYSAYGTSSAWTASFSPRASTSYQWETRDVGYWHDIDTQLTLIRNRYLHSRLGVWLTRDPIPTNANFGLYEYVRSQPISLSDPFGLLPPCVWGAGAGFAFGLLTSLYSSWAG